MNRTPMGTSSSPVDHQVYSWVFVDFRRFTRELYDQPEMALSRYIAYVILLVACEISNHTDLQFQIDIFLGENILL